MALQSSKSPSLPQNDAPNAEEQSFEATISGVGILTSIGVTTPIASQKSVSTMLPKVVVPPPQPTSFPTTLRVTQTIIGDPSPSFLPSFTFPKLVRNIHMASQLQ